MGGEGEGWRRYKRGGGGRKELEEGGRREGEVRRVEGGRR